uniref:C-type lectin domain-containing protein n=1 Tax=Acrobeloides nanus TaxID=290746 RepID=A0A914EBI6_9BILA
MFKVILIFSSVCFFAIQAACPKDASVGPDGKCYVVLTNTVAPYDWVHVEPYCKSRGGHSVSIHSKVVNSFLVNLMVSKGLQGIWTGLYCSQDSQYKYKWIDGTPVDYNNYYLASDQFPCSSSNPLYCGFLDNAGDWHSSPGAACNSNNRLPTWATACIVPSTN